MRAGKEIRSAVHHLTIAAGDVENLEAEIRTLKAKAAEVVAELRSLARGTTSSTASNAFSDASDIVAEKLGVKEANDHP